MVKMRCLIEVQEWGPSLFIWQVDSHLIVLNKCFESWFQMCGPQVLTNQVEWSHFLEVLLVWVHFQILKKV